MLVLIKPIPGFKVKEKNMHIVDGFKMIKLDLIFKTNNKTMSSNVLFPVRVHMKHQLSVVHIQIFYVTC